MILSACSANEVSREADEHRHGLFTFYLLEGLNGAADTNSDGIVTINELHSYVSLKVPRASGQDMHPVKKGEMVGDIPIGILK